MRAGGRGWRAWDGGAWTSLRGGLRAVLFGAVLVAAAGPAHARRGGGPGDFDPRAYGAAGDGKSLDTKALQAAIDACAAAGGGRVVLAGGTFLSGTIVLRSGVALVIEAGATLLGSTRLEDYPPMPSAFRTYAENYTDKSLIYAEKQEGVSILGRGTIHGQGGAPAFRGKPYKERPYLIRIVECRNVAVRDVTLRDSPMWVQHYLACEDVLLDGLTVHSLANQNNDGVDVDSCARVRISNCSITSGDDAIVLKSTSPRPCEDVAVTGCLLSSRCNAFELGTESTGGFRDIVLAACTIRDTLLAGVALETVDGGTLERVSVSGVTMRNVRGGIFIRLGNRGRPYLAKGPGGGAGTWSMPPGVDLPRPPVARLSGVVIRDVQAAGVDRIGCAIAGLPGHPVEDLTLEHVRFRFAGGGTPAEAAREVPEREDKYPEYTMFGPLPAYGFYVRHARNVRFHHLDVAFEREDARPALFFDDARDVGLVDVKARAGPGAPGIVRFREVAEAWVHACSPFSPEVPFLRLEGAGSGRIRLWGNDWSGVKAPVERGGGVGEGAVTVR